MPGLGLSASPPSSSTTTARRAKSTDLQLLPPSSSGSSISRGIWEDTTPSPRKASTTTVVTSSLPNPRNNNNSAITSSSSVNEKPKLDPSDPRVKKLVYSMYRDMLTTYNGEANDIINKQDPARVSQDSGVGPILESIVLRQRGSQGGSGELPGTEATAEGQVEDGSGSSNGNHCTMPPPPPPPPMMPGSLPAVRLRSEIGHRDAGPPAALASAMMKDKKPFTYTPGGIDLSEIRSPRMAKRIQMNAAAEGVTNTPTSSTNQERPPPTLPPAALAAMQPQMAIPVFPQGSSNNVHLNKSHRPSDYTSQPPPPPPPVPMNAQIRPQNAAPPPPPPLSPHQLQPRSPASSPIPHSPIPAPPERAVTPKSPVPNKDAYLESPRPQFSNQDERKSPLGRKSPGVVEPSSGVGTGSLFIPPISQQQSAQQQSPPQLQCSPSPLSTYVPPSARSPGQTKAQAVSQSIGSLYIPPITAANKGDSQEYMGVMETPSNGNAPVSRTPQSAQQQQQQPQTVPNTPQLNKAPVPWMNSYNRLQSQQADSPPYVHPGFFMPPWGPPPGARTIPIMRESDQTDGGANYQGSDSRRSSASGGSTPSGSRTPSQAATHLGRVIPIQIEREEAAKAKGAKIIPIQIEGRPPRTQTPSTPMTPVVMMNPMRRAVAPAAYNSPIGLYSNQNAMDAYQRQAADAAAGVEKMNIRCESPRMEPIQSKALRVIQQAAENELKRLEQEQLQRSMDVSAEPHLMNLLKSQADEGSSYQIAEPRFMGSHIPSKAFRALQTALPTGPGFQDQQPKSYPVAQAGGPVTHHIPIRQVAQSPTPQHSQPSEIQLGSHQPNVPPSEQKVQEPKKYMGSNIPSRSFKMLQQMTSEDGQPVGSSETGISSEEQNIADFYTDDDTSSACPSAENPEGYLNLTYSSFPLSPSCSSEGGGSATYDPYNCSVNNNNNNGYYDSDGLKSNDGDYQNMWPDGMDPSWDPYSYMWYYWWYYSSCYWAGYDMTGYEYPAGWDPNYPYCPPEFFSKCSDEYATDENGEYLLNLENTDDGNSPSSATDLHKSFPRGHDDNDYVRMDSQPYPEKEELASSPSSSSSFVPKIVIEDKDKIGGAVDNKLTNEKRNSSVDSIKGNNSISRANNNRNDNNESSSTSSKVPTTSPLTGCNQKPGSPLPWKKNDCDSTADASKWKDENFAECGRQKLTRNSNDNDSEERKDVIMGKEEEEDSSPTSSDDEYESCCEDPDQKVIERETGPFNNKPNSTTSRNPFFGTGEQQQSSHDNYDKEKNENEDIANEECSDDEKTDPGIDEDDDDYGGKIIIEEPETQSSDSDVATLSTEQQHQRTGNSSFYDNGNGLSIEEYHSEESSESTVFDYGPRKSRLSTIDEITESRASSSLLSSTKTLTTEFDRCSSTRNQNNSGEYLKNLESNGKKLTSKEDSDGSDESSEDELSSVSVIENKSDATRATESKREDETTSTSDEEEEEDDDDEPEGNDTAVTVRLPLKLSFTKTKSYRDITTVMVGDSEIEEATSASSQFSPSNNRAENESIFENGNDDGFSEKNGEVKEDMEEDDDEPVVSFTLSLSRQTSREAREAETKEECDKKVESGGCSDEVVDIDFWAEITKGEENENDTDSGSACKNATTEEKGNQENEGDYEKKNEDSGGEGFWGVITRDRSASDFPRRRNGKGKRGGTCDGHNPIEDGEQDWDPYESIDYKWEKDFNFWEKSSRTIETRRFTDFEITEDYESDSGLKPSSSGKKERVKKYTHHKRHSIPGPSWDRASLPPRPNSKQTKDSSTRPNTGLVKNEQEIQQDSEFSEDKHFDSQGKSTILPSDKQDASTGSSQEDADASSWWSYWDEVTKHNGDEEYENNNNNNEDDDDVKAAAHDVQSPKIDPTSYRGKGGGMSDVVLESKEKLGESTLGKTKLSENESNGESMQIAAEDYQSFAHNDQAYSSSEPRGAEVSREKDSKILNSSCQSDAMTVSTDSENYSSSPEIKSSLLFPCPGNHEAEKLIQRGSSSVSDENSDESSSRSSGTTIGRTDKSEIKNITSTSTTATQPLTTLPLSVPPDEVTASSREKSGADGDQLYLETETQSKLGSEEKESGSAERADSSIQIPLTIERNIEIQHELGERSKLKHQEEQHYHHHLHNTSTSAITNSSTSTTNTTTSTCTCLGDRIARAESLLWRIERFLHESLSLGSEDDSGVMTDLSRQISDVDTDVDNDLNETEFLLTAAAVAKERRGVTPSNIDNINTSAPDSTKDSQQHIESCNFAETISCTDRMVNQNQLDQARNTGNNASASSKRPRPKSDIFLDSTQFSKQETEEICVEENNGVKLRSASERRALRYQRAKTHSRLFQLLQDECGRDEELDEFDYDSDVGTLTCSKTMNNNVVDCQISVDTSAVAVTNIHQRNCNTNNDGNSAVMEDSRSNDAVSSPTRMNEAQARRSRLLPLPIKNLLASSLSLDSNSSPSGSSGVLSPTSPVNRDQLLADIINEFHLRNQASTIRAQSQRRISSSFPSKVFKLLQHEFGEEFYQTFDCCAEDSLISPSMSTNLCVNDSGSSLTSCCGGGAGAHIMHECTIHKSESMKEFEEATNRILTNFMLRNHKIKPTASESPCSTAISSKLLQEDSKSNTDFLEVPLRKKKGNLSRDSRSPKSTK